MLATLWVCTCAPAAMGARARPIELPYFTTGAPAAIPTRATLCPAGIGSRTATVAPATTTGSPGVSARRAVATLSRASMAMTSVTD